MTDFAFNRVYHLQVVNKGATEVTARGVNTTGIVDDFLTGADTQSPLLVPTQVTSDLAVAEIEFNRLAARLKFSSASSIASSDSHEIKVYNLDRDTINALRTEKAVVILRAGYKEQYPDTPPSGFPEIFKGEVTTCKVMRQGNDTITEIGLSSAATERKTSRVSAKFRPSTTLLAMLQVVTSKLGLNTKINIGDKANIVINKQKSYSGATLEVLDRISKEYGLLTYIQNEILQVTDILGSGSVVNNPAIIISNDSIKGSLSSSIDYSRSRSGKGVNEVDFDVFLNPNILVGSIVRVNVEGNTGDYRVETVTHKLDTHGTAWDTHISASEISSKSVVDQNEVQDTTNIA